jgi:hypothetical protein
MRVETIFQKRKPGIIPLHVLAPDPVLLEETRKSEILVDEFTNGCDYPVALVDLLAQYGYAPDDYGRGMLFVSDSGVSVHADEKLSVLWVLACDAGGDSQLQLIVGKQFITLYPGAVMIFDATQHHAVINSIGQRWAVYSMYVKKRRVRKLKKVNEGV